jgi:hypothetical protein
MQQISDKMVSVDKRLISAFGNLFVGINNLQIFHTTTKDLLETGKNYVEEKVIKTGKEEFAKPEWQRFSSIKRLADYESLGFKNSILQATAKRSVRISKQVVDSAALVFAHTILDGTLSECCRISFEADPSDWFPFVDKRKVELGSLKNVGPEAIFSQKAKEFVEQLNRESMIQRLDVLNKVCGPKWNGEKPITHWIERAHLEEFDLVRHRVIHSQAFAQKNTGVEDQILYAGLVGVAALVLVGKAYGLKAEGILDKENTNVDEIWSKLMSGVSNDFPEIREQFDHDLPKIMEFIRNSHK